MALVVGDRVRLKLRWARAYRIDRVGGEVIDTRFVTGGYQIKVRRDNIKAPPRWWESEVWELAPSGPRHTAKRPAPRAGLRKRGL